MSSARILVVEDDAALAAIVDAQLPYLKPFLVDDLLSVVRQVATHAG